ncbi:MAG: glycosyltransferase family 4 protein [Solirubrobacterales bacterium]
MRILQLHNLYRQRGGEDASAEAEAEALERAGHEVVRHLVRNPETPRATVATLARAPANRASAARVRELVRSHRPDVAHVNNTWFTLTPSVFAALADEGVPTVHTLHNYRLLCVNSLLFRDNRPCTDCVGRGPWPGVIHRCYRDSLPASVAAATTITVNRRRGSWQGIDRLIAPSEFARGIFAGAGFDPERISVVPGMVADPGPRSAPPSSSREVIYAGRLSPEKGLDLLLDAWAEVGAALDLDLTIYGDGPMRAQLEAKLPPRARLVGWCDRAELEASMLSARALVFPSQCYETFGRATGEAFAAGLPVLGSAEGAAGELLATQGDRLSVAGNDLGGWADSLGALTDDSLVDRAGSLGRAHFETNLAAPVVVERLTAVYADAVAGAADGQLPWPTTHVEGTR